jgi:hypothetical protein
MSGLQQSLYDWVDATLQGTATPKDLWLVEYSTTSTQPRDAIHIADAELAKIAFPELDASAAKDQALITAKLRASSSVHPYPCCGPFSGSAGNALQQKQSNVSDFRFELGSLPATRVRSVSAFEVTTDPSGVVHFGDIEVAVSLQDTNQWANWFEDFAIDGHDNSSTRKQGRIILRNLTLGTDIAVIDLGDVGVFRRGPGVPSETTAGGTDVYSLFVERATFSIPGAAPTGTTSTTQSTSTATTTAQTTTAQTTTAQTTTATTTTIPTPPQPPPPVEGTVGAPEGLEVQAGEGQAVLTWLPVEGATSYVILMSLNPKELTQVGEAGTGEKEPSFTAEKLESGQTYYFVVRAVRGEKQSDDSKVAQVDVK